MKTFEQFINNKDYNKHDIFYKRNKKFNQDVYGIISSIDENNPDIIDIYISNSGNIETSCSSLNSIEDFEEYFKDYKKINLDELINKLDVNQINTLLSSIKGFDEKLYNKLLSFDKVHDATSLDQIGLL